MNGNLLWRIGLLTLAPLLGPLACGDPLRESGYSPQTQEYLESLPGPEQPKPLLTVRGNIVSMDTEPVTEGRALRILVLWDLWTRQGDVPSYLSYPAGSGPFPGAYELDIPAPPPQEALNDLGSVKFGNGWLQLYSDVNGDGVFTEKLDVVRALSREHVLFYVPAVTPEVIAELRGWGRLRNPEALAVGFNIARGVCSGEDLFDSLEIVAADSPINFEATSSVEESPDYCLNFY